MSRLNVSLRIWLKIVFSEVFLFSAVSISVSGVAGIFFFFFLLLLFFVLTFPYLVVLMSLLKAFQKLPYLFFPKMVWLIFWQGIVQGTCYWIAGWEITSWWMGRYGLYFAIFIIAFSSWLGVYGTEPSLRKLDAAGKEGPVADEGI